VGRLNGRKSGAAAPRERPPDTNRILRPPFSALGVRVVVDTRVIRIVAVVGVVVGLLVVRGRQEGGSVGAVILVMAEKNAVQPPQNRVIVRMSVKLVVVMMNHGRIVGRDGIVVVIARGRRRRRVVRTESSGREKQNGDDRDGCVGDSHFTLLRSCRANPGRRRVVSSLYAHHPLLICRP